MTDQTAHRARWEARFAQYDAHDFRHLATIGMALADEEQQSAAAYPAETSWIAETQGTDDQWMFLRANRDRAVVEQCIASVQKRFPRWADGTPVNRRIVRKTTTYTVDTAPAVTEEPTR